MTTPLLELENLHTFFYTDNGVAQAVDGVSFAVGPLDPASGAPARPHRARQRDALRGSRPHDAGRARDAAHPRQSHRDGVSGTDDGAEPGLHDRRSDRRGGARARRDEQARVARESGRDAQAGRHPRAGAARRRIPASALGRHASARRHRDGARHEPRTRHRRRADDRARRHHPGADPRAARRSHTPTRDVRPAHHARSRRRGGELCARHRNVCGRGRRGSRDGRPLRARTPPLHGGAPGGDATRRRREGPAGDDSGHRAGADELARGLPLPRSMPVLVGAL